MLSAYTKIHNKRKLVEEQRKEALCHSTVTPFLYILLPGGRQCFRFADGAHILHKQPLL